MKRDAINSTKLKKLCKRLDLRLYMGVGLMESLWHLAAREAPQGDIGKLSDDDIALAMDYVGDAAKLIAALVECRWLDESEGHRLVVHGWAEHCEDAIDMKLARALLLYADGSQPRMKRLSTKERVFLCEQYAAIASLNAPVRTKTHKSAPPMPMPMPKVSDATHPHPAEGGERKQSAEELIYQKYPRHEGHRAAITAIGKAVERVRHGEGVISPIPTNREAQIFLYRRVEEYARSPAGTRPDKEKVPHPATWFNQSRYLDDEQAWQISGGENGKSHAQAQQARTHNAFEQARIPRLDFGGTGENRALAGGGGDDGEDRSDGG